MFAARFDPTAIVDTSSNNANIEKKKVIPLKRTRDVKSDSEDGESDEEEEEEEIVIPQKKVEEDTEGESEESVKNEDEELEENDNEENNEDIKDDKHTLVMSRFHQTLSLQERISEKDKTSIDTTTTQSESVIDGDTNEENTHNLESIPQPDIVRADKSVKNAIEESHLTAWINTKKVYYDNTMIKLFDEYEDELTPKLLNNIKSNFSKETFSIQTILLDTALPILNRSMKLTKKNMTRRVGDMLINASTGSGKTLAYSVPIVQALSNRTVNRLRVLIIVPTKLLIQQVFETLNTLIKGTSLIITTAKMDQSLNEERRKLQQSEPDIFITTPGRLVDLLQMKSISLKNLKFLILDEADRLLNQSFQNWCSEIMSAINTDKTDRLPGNVIKMVFSATLSSDTQKLHDLHLYNPKLFLTDSVKLYNLPSTLQEYNISIPTAKSLYKPLLLVHLFPLLNDDSKLIVFVKSNEASLRLATLINIILQKKNMDSKISVESFNSNNSRAQNRKLVTDFSSSNENGMSVLITTDIMSRGIDITNVTDVINYDVPISSQQYVHRCGRTARAGASGNAYNYLVGKGERTFWSQHVSNDISRDINGHQPVVWSKVDDQNNKRGDGDGDVDMEADTNTQDTDTSEKYKSIIDISDDEDAIYKEALNELKELVAAK
ncbi:ATP-dependent RNA helicase dbp6 [Maudiozyma exigua]|uniref:ATP-dependent RNA helicase n=1 Tax=Maudiozyma exigua TaxID=34358 RepID=A0A9P7BC60_MAUEX|nr:ATP-dependent RNA helicase dbp6 [Kazachstania exigua]